MTLDQFRDMASEGLVVECLTVQERRNTLVQNQQHKQRISSDSGRGRL